MGIVHASTAYQETRKCNKTIYCWVLTRWNELRRQKVIPQQNKALNSTMQPFTDSHSDSVKTPTQYFSESWVPLSVYSLSNWLMETLQSCNDVLKQHVNVSDFLLANSFLHVAAYLIIYRVEVPTLGDEAGEMKSKVSLTSIARISPSLCDVIITSVTPKNIYW